MSKLETYLCNFRQYIEKKVCQKQLLNHKVENTSYGFTLAEVLITLLIIGVVASLVIPGLINNTNNQENVVQLKKTYATLQQAFSMLQTDNGGSILSLYQSDVAGTGGNVVMNAFLTKLNYVKNCGSSMGCWYNTPLYFLDGSQGAPALDNAWNNSYGKAILSNGTMISLSVSSANCAYIPNSGSALPPLNKVCGGISVDINGDKGPNKSGKDYFPFWVTQTGIYPFGSFNDGYSCNTNGDANHSHGCTAKVLNDGAMNY